MLLGCKGNPLFDCLWVCVAPTIEHHLSQATAGRAAGLCWEALGQHVHRCLEGDPDPNQCFGMAKWDALGKLWGQTWLGLAI